MYTGAVTGSDFKVVDKNCCYVTIVTFHDSEVSKIIWEGIVQLFDPAKLVCLMLLP